MTFILDELREKCLPVIKAKHVWEYLNTLYDIEELTRLNKENDENLDKLTDFELPIEKFGQFLKKDSSTPSPRTETEALSEKEEESAPETVTNTSKNTKSKRKEETSKTIVAIAKFQLLGW
ncbi:DgyrCDS3507 [Dimorphilus gyrociliatus]|uniref:DgyrCDS3507 n=1 Tax=Dimorphilus gyrociliatus TaxID=2664684 RepID=A0A7I8VDH2_9ANNE|nr:DgyrCDS3507 [Dimorphilus gyrociliatus]